MRQPMGTYNIEGMDIRVEVRKDFLEASTSRGESTYRIKMKPGSDIPFAGRFHCSIAAAEPVIPQEVYFALVSAVTQHGKKRSTSSTRKKPASLSSN